MVDVNTPATEDVFEDVATAIGDAWDFAKQPVLTGNYLGSATIEMDDRDQEVFQFAPVSDPSAIVFVWASNSLRGFAGKAVLGDVYRFTYLGTTAVEAKNGETYEVRQYKVQHKAS
jgi:hypothetical protein